MVVLNRIYTRAGDGGETSLGDGRRTAKDSPRVTAYGTVDELNSVIGVARLHAGVEDDSRLASIQQDLFDLGADLCKPSMPGEEESSSLRIVPAQVQRLEHEIDRATSRLQPLRSFVLPGGTAMSAHLHQCRTVTRRAERNVMALSRVAAINPNALQYLNRLSDWFFVQARLANDGGKSDVLWVPGTNRSD